MKILSRNMYIVLGAWAFFLILALIHSNAGISGFIVYFATHIIINIILFFVHLIRKTGNASYFLLAALFVAMAGFSLCTATVVIGSSLRIFQ